MADQRMRMFDSRGLEATSRAAIAAPERGRPAGGRSGALHGLLRAIGNAGAQELLAGRDHGVRPEQIRAGLGSGAPLSFDVARAMGAVLEHDVTGVRVHTDAAAGGLADSLGARAVTIGDHVAFAPGQYRPDDAGGARLLAHELTHVKQQRRGLSSQLLERGIGEPGDGYEREANAAGERAVATLGFDSGFAPALDPGPVAAAAHTSGPVALQLDLWGQSAVMPSAPVKEPPRVTKQPKPTAKPYDRSAAVAYAKKWALAKDGNPDYVRFNQDCTNFVSQALLAGGQRMVKPQDDLASSTKDESVWWYEKDAVWHLFGNNEHSSWTWSVARTFNKWLTNSGRATLVDSPMKLELGDVLQMDYGDDHIKHTMLVTTKTDDDIKLSYHSDDHLDEPMYAPHGIKARNPGAKYYPMKVK